MKRESISATREAETSVVSFIIEEEENNFFEIQKKLIDIVLNEDNYTNLNEYKKNKNELRKILRENLRELKYLENVPVDNEFIFDNADPAEINKKLTELKEMLNEKGFNNFYLEFHFGKNGDNHVQILADKKEKEKEIKKVIFNFLNKKEKVEIKDEKLKEFLSKLDKQLNNIFEKVDKKIEEAFKNSGNAISKADDFLSNYKNIDVDIKEETTSKTTSKRQ